MVDPRVWPYIRPAHGDNTRKPSLELTKARMSRAPARLILRSKPDQAIFAKTCAGSPIDLTFDSRLCSLTSFICFQSYGNSFPQSRHTT
jgi:hypothetical protein